MDPSGIARIDRLAQVFGVLDRLHGMLAATVVDADVGETRPLGVELLSGTLRLAKVYGQEEPPAAEDELEWEVRYFVLYDSRRIVHHDDILDGLRVTSFASREGGVLARVPRPRVVREVERDARRRGAPAEPRSRCARREQAPHGRCALPSGPCLPQGRACIKRQIIKTN